MPNVIVTTSWDDGHPLDVKLANLLAEFRINGTFYVSSKNRERSVMLPKNIRDISKHFEIGAHSLTHRRLNTLNNHDLEKEIKDNKMLLEDIISRTVDMFCYPSGIYSTRVWQVVMNSGFIGARTTQEFRLSLPNNALQMPTTLQAYPHSPFIRIRHALKTRNWPGILELMRMGCGKNWKHLACDFFNKVCEEGGVWHLWGHSWEIEQYDLWDDLRLILETVAGHNGVRYMTNGQIISEMYVSRLV